VTPHDLRQLAKIGLLTRVDESRGGDRVYYRLNAPRGLQQPRTSSWGRSC
jgi:hypothetical protein